MATIQQWGNDLAVRIPVELANQLEVAAGTPIEITTRHGALVVTPRRPTKYSLREMLKQTKPEHLHPLVDFGPDLGREVLD